LKIEAWAVVFDIEEKRVALPSQANPNSAVTASAQPVIPSPKVTRSSSTVVSVSSMVVVKRSYRQNERIADTSIDAQNVHEGDRMIDVWTGVAVLSALHAMLPRSELNRANHQINLIGTVHADTLHRLLEIGASTTYCASLFPREHVA
jgi:hypothetical protein